MANNKKQNFINLRTNLREEFSLNHLFALRHAISNNEMAKEQAVNILDKILAVLEKYFIAKQQDQHDRIFEEVSSCLKYCLFELQNQDNCLSNIVNTQLFDFLPGLVSVMDTKSSFAKINMAKAKVMGYDYQDDVEGSSYDIIKGDAASRCEIFQGEDEQIIKTKKPFSYLSYNQYADDKWLLLIGEKTPIFDCNKKEVIGVLSQAKDFTDSKLFDISRFLIDQKDLNWRNIRRKAFSYFVFEEESDLNKLTKKDMETLFYILRGQTAKEIAKIVNRTYRTIEDRQTVLKNKFNVDSLSQLKEKAIAQGYMNILPEDILSNPVMKSV